MAIGAAFGLSTSTESAKDRGTRSNGSHASMTPHSGARMADARRIEVPTFLVGGWYDLYADAMVRIFNEVGGDRRLVIGPWLHVAPDRVEGEPFDWVGQMCQWWDRYLVPAPEYRTPTTLGVLRNQHIPNRLPWCM